MNYSLDEYRRKLARWSLIGALVSTGAAGTPDEVRLALAFKKYSKKTDSIIVEKTFEQTEHLAFEIELMSTFPLPPAEGGHRIMEMGEVNVDYSKRPRPKQNTWVSLAKIVDGGSSALPFTLNSSGSGGGLMSGKPRYKHREIRFVSMVINNDSLGRLAEARKYLQWQMENYKPRSGVTPKTSPEGFEKAAGFIASQATYRAVGEYEIRVRFDYADAAGKHASVTTCDTIEVVKGRDYIELHKESSLPLQPGPDD